MNGELDTIFSETEERGQEKQMTNTSNKLLETFREIANYIQQNPGLPHTINSMAEGANLYQRYFSQNFKQVIGHTVKSYIVYSRIKLADHVLHSTGITVTEC